MARYPIPPREFSTFGAGQHKHQQTPRRRRLLAFVDAEGKVRWNNNAGLTEEHGQLGGASPDGRGMSLALAFFALEDT